MTNEEAGKLSDEAIKAPLKFIVRVLLITIGGLLLVIGMFWRAHLADDEAERQKSGEDVTKANARADKFEAGWLDCQNKRTERAENSADRLRENNKSTTE